MPKDESPEGVLHAKRTAVAMVRARLHDDDETQLRLFETVGPEHLDEMLQMFMDMAVMAARIVAESDGVEPDLILDDLARRLAIL